MSNFKIEQMDMGSSDIDSFLTTPNSELGNQHVGSSMLATLDVAPITDFDLRQVAMGSIAGLEVEIEKANRAVTATRKTRTKVASIGQLTPFMRISADTLVHKSDKDLWALRKEADGNYYIERLFDDNGTPMKG